MMTVILVVRVIIIVFAHVGVAFRVTMMIRIGV